MSFRLAAVLSTGMVALAALGASLVAVASASPLPTGSIHGYVYNLVGPVAGYKKATFTAVVELTSSGHVVAVDRVPPGAQFHFTEPAGTYAIKVAGHPSYPTTVSFVAHKDHLTTVRCTPYKGGPAPG